MNIVSTPWTQKWTPSSCNRWKISSLVKARPCHRDMCRLRAKAKATPGAGKIFTMRVVLIATYEMGRQPFGLASPAAWLRQAGATVVCQDLSRSRLDREVIAAADVVAFYVPMHTATRIAAHVVQHVKALNPRAHLCFYGLYAPVNETFLRSLGADTILGGEFESGLLSLIRRLQAGQEPAAQQPEPVVSLKRQ